MKRIKFLIFALFAFLGVQAQTINFEVGGGFAKHYGPSEVVGSYKIGLTYEYELDQHWSISPGLFLYGKGWKDPNTLVPIVTLDDEPVYEADGVTQRMGVKSVSSAANYLTLPILFSYYLRLGEERYLFFGAGPYVAYGVFGNRKIKGDTSLPGTQKFLALSSTFSHPDAKRFDAGLVTKVGYQLSREFSVGLEGNFGMVKSLGGSNLSALITLAYRLQWGGTHVRGDILRKATP